MDKSPVGIVLILAAGGLLGLRAASDPGYVEQAPKQVSDGSAQPAPVAQPPAKVGVKQPNAILFKNVKVFDGKSDKLSANTSVLVVGNKVEKIGSDIAAPEQSFRNCVWFRELPFR